MSARLAEGHSPPARLGTLPETPLGRALGRALRGPQGRAVLRLSEPAAHRRSAARALLLEGALAGGGQLVEGRGGDLLLVGPDPRRAERMRGLLEKLLGQVDAVIWSLDRDAETVLAYARGGAAAPPRAQAGPDLAALDPAVDALPLDRVLARHRGWALAPGAPPRPAFLRLAPDRAKLAAALGLLGADRDLLDHAAERLARRLLAAIADPRSRGALLAGDPARPVPAEARGALHLPLPPGLLLPGPGAGVPGPGGPVATLPLTAAAAPAALAARRAGLAAAGWRLELDGLDEAGLRLLDPGRLGADLLRLRWSAALPAVPLRGLDPARLVLAGAEGAAALDWARRVGLGFVEAPG